jgi:hypothetical protein
MILTLPPQEVLHKRLAYDPITGRFVWRKGAVKGRARLDVPAGTEGGNGYRFINMRKYGKIGIHRLAWIYINGPIPNGMEVDHRDCDPQNNAIANLRLATSAQQKMNKRIQSNSRSGLKGAFYHAAHRGKKWRSQIKVAGTYIFLGYFHSPEEAHEAYREAADRHFGEFARAA